MQVFILKASDGNNSDDDLDDGDEVNVRWLVVSSASHPEHMSHPACSVPHVCSQTCLSATSLSQPLSLLKRRGNNREGNRCQKVPFAFIAVCVLILENCIPAFVLRVSSHRLGWRREKICEFLCELAPETLVSVFSPPSQFR